MPKLTLGSTVLNLPHAKPCRHWRLIRSVAPDAIEELKWSRPCYSNAKGLFCYLHTTQSYATLGFQKGAAIDDPEGLLEGTGKDMRHIKFNGGRSPDDPAIVVLLKQAVSSSSR